MRVNQKNWQTDSKRINKITAAGSRSRFILSTEKTPFSIERG